MNDLEKILRSDLQSSGITKRSPKKIDDLKAKAETLQSLFDKQGFDVKVKVNFNSGFNSLGFISIEGKTIPLLSKQVSDIIEEAAYVNIILDDPEQIVFEMAFTNLNQ